MRGEALAGGEQPEVGVLEWRDLREIARRNHVEACGGAEAVQGRARSAEGAQGAEGAEGAVVTTARGRHMHGVCMRICMCTPALLDYR